MDKEGEPDNPGSDKPINWFIGRPTTKPAGSGWFSLLIGVLFLACVLIFVVWRIDPESFTGGQLLAAWTTFAGLILVAWGARRILATAKKNDPTIGQNTINLVVGILAVTFTIWSIILTSK